MSLPASEGAAAGWTWRVRPMPGEIGHPGTCPLCAHGEDTPPCLACRDELRARLAESFRIDPALVGVN